MPGPAVHVDHWTKIQEVPHSRITVIMTSVIMAIENLVKVIIAVETKTTGPAGRLVPMQALSCSDTLSIDTLAPHSWHSGVNQCLAKRYRNENLYRLVNHVWLGHGFSYCVSKLA